MSGDEEIVERSAFLYDALHASRRASPPADTRAARDALALAWFWLR